MGKKLFLIKIEFVYLKVYLKIKDFITIPFVLFLAYMVYQGNPHIYHSQQVPSTYEAFGRLPRSNSYMELYPSSPYAGYPSSGYGGVRGAILGKIQNSLKFFLVAILSDLSINDTLCISFSTIFKIFNKNKTLCYISFS